MQFLQILDCDILALCLSIAVNQINQTAGSSSPNKCGINTEVLFAICKFLPIFVDIYRLK